jgi:N-methylhydantoinase B
VRALGAPERIVFKGTEIPLAKGDAVTFLTAGGGGYGDPSARGRDLVTRDVAEGFVSADKARVYYGWRASASAPSSLSA